MRRIRKRMFSLLLSAALIAGTCPPRAVWAAEADETAMEVIDAAEEADATTAESTGTEAAETDEAAVQADAAATDVASEYNEGESQEDTLEGVTEDIVYVEDIDEESVSDDGTGSIVYVEDVGEEAVSEDAEAVVYVDGIYEGSGTGYSNGTITVEVTIEDGKITKIETVEAENQTTSY